MIGKAKSVRGSVAGMDYLREEGKGYELGRNRLIGETSDEIMQEFRMQQMNNSTCDKNMITAVISPDIKDGEKLNSSELKEIGKSFMNKIGIDTDKQAYIMIVHTEKAHKHIHIYANRIQENGKAIEDKFIGKRASAAAHLIAKEKGLISAKEIMIEKKNRYNDYEKSVRSSIFKRHKIIMITKPKGFSDYIKQMRLQGLEVKPTINKQGLIQGFRVTDLQSKKEFKMSDVNRSMSVGNLLKSGLKNDLDNNLTKTLKTVQNKQDATLYLKKTIVPKKNDFNISNKENTLSIFKGKATLKEYIEWQKHLEIFEPAQIKDWMESLEKEHQNQLKEYEDWREQYNKEEIKNKDDDMNKYRDDDIYKDTER